MPSDKELSSEAKQLVYDAIVNYVYAEEEGRIRAPQNVSDFRYHYLSSEKVLVFGSSFSPMDQKVITYKCDIDVIGRGIIESVYDFEIASCDLKL